MYLYVYVLMFWNCFVYVIINFDVFYTYLYYGKTVVIIIIIIMTVLQISHREKLIREIRI